MLRSNSIDDTDSEMMSAPPPQEDEIKVRRPSGIVRGMCMSSTKLVVLLVLCLQNSLFTLLRRYSQGVRKEKYSKYEVLLLGEILKMIFSAYMIQRGLIEDGGGVKLSDRLGHLVVTSKKMVILSLIYGTMNILGFVSLKNIGAGVFTVFAQSKILTTAVCSTLMLQRRYTSTQWRALISLSLGVLLFSSPIWTKEGSMHNETGSTIVGVSAVITEVTLSGFASVYFEKVIKKDAQKVTIWERNFQLALASFPVYLGFIAIDSPLGVGTGWSFLAFVVASLGAAGGLLVALSIKYGDSILKTLATTGAIVLSSVLDHLFMDGLLTPVMVIAGVQVVLAICNYTFDTTPARESLGATPSGPARSQQGDEEVALVKR